VWNSWGYFFQLNAKKLPSPIIHLFGQQVQFPVNACNSDSRVFSEGGAQGAFGAKAFVTSSSCPSQDLFLSGQGGIACSSSKGHENQARLPKKQTPSRSRVRGSFIQTLLRHLWHSSGKALHFFPSSCSLRDHLQQILQFPSSEGSQQQCPAGSAELCTAHCWAELCKTA